jgi:hypothetical protein
VAAEKKKAPPRYGVVAGTVFEENGKSLPGAEVSVTPLGTESGGAVKPLKAKSDSRGEFGIRVPAGSMRYNVRVEAKGFQAQEKEVLIEWDQRVDIFFRLPAISATGEQK